MRAFSIIGSERPAARGSLRTPLDQLAGDVLAQLGVEQFGEQAEQFFGPIAAAVALRPPAEVLDHRLQRAELALHLVAELRVRRRHVRAARLRRSGDCGRRLFRRRARASGWARSRRARPSPRSAAGRAAQPSQRLRTSRVCSTAASGPIRDAPSPTPRASIAARKVRSSMAERGIRD